MVPPLSVDGKDAETSTATTQRAPSSFVVSLRSSRLCGENQGAFFCQHPSGGLSHFQSAEPALRADQRPEVEMGETTTRKPKFVYRRFGGSLPRDEH